jgi:SAM-dependent methyltransferase
MPNLRKRSYQAELLDADEIPQELLFQNLKELDVVNHYLGGHNITLTGIKQLLPQEIRKNLLKNSQKTLHIVDIGCGSGDTLIEIAKWAAKQKLTVKLTGVDMKADVILYATAHCKKYSNITFIEADYRDTTKYATEEVDIFVCSLFCHHLKEPQLIELFKFIDYHSQIGFIINDLQRHALAYYGIRYLTKLFNGSSLVQNDAPLSVWRGFFRNELEVLLHEANVKKYTITWEWAFRYLIVGQKS